MRDYIDVTGKNEDEAISKALAQLNLDRDDVSVEVLDQGKKGFLGLGSVPAKVRVSYGLEAEGVEKAAPAAAVQAPAERRGESGRPPPPKRP